jgi:ketosteroid isomerase-like protein
MRNSGATRGLLVVLLTAAAGHAPASPQALPQAPPQVLKDEIVAQERAELDSLKTGDMTAFANFLADDAVFVDAAGSAGKPDVVKNTAGFRLRDYAITNLKFVALSADSGLIAYQLTESGTSHGKEFSANVNVSALWLKRGGRWVCKFSQETPAK